MLRCVCFTHAPRNDGWGADCFVRIYDSPCDDESDLRFTTKIYKNFTKPCVLLLHCVVMISLVLVVYCNLSATYRVC
ncbi:hypothetical protein [Helicobacter sp. 23-1045]